MAVTTLSEFQKIVETTLGHRSMAGTALAAGLKRDAIRSVIKTGNDPTLSRVGEICAALDLELYIGPSRSQASADAKKTIRNDHHDSKPMQPVRPDLQSQFDELKKEFLEIRRRLQPISKEVPSAPTIHTIAKGPRDASAVEIMELNAATGEGPCNLAEMEPLKPSWFRDVWINRHHLDPAQALILTARGNSMGATIPDSSKILVDRSRQWFNPDHFYVLNTDEGLVVKRMRRSDDGGWMMVSDNNSPNWPDIPWKESDEVIGEIRWMSKEMPRVTI